MYDTCYIFGMSEMYGKCAPCAGPDCFICSGTGFNGDALVYISDQNSQEWQSERRGSWFTSSVERARTLQKMEHEFTKKPKRTLALWAAIHAVEQHTQKTKGREHMSNIQVRQDTSVGLAQKFGFTESQLDLVKRTVAKNATDDELELFFYRCKELQLNPLMPGQVYFLKFGSAPGTIVIGLDGFRSRAQRTGKLVGIKRGVVRDSSGKCIGAWADVYRRDWDHPAHEEVALSEYFDQRKPIWKNMPETMIKKVAEVAALRMAFPEELGGVYSEEEMHQADKSPSVKNVESEIMEQKPSQPQIARMFAIAKNAEISDEDLRKMIKHPSSKDLTIKEYNEICEKLTQIAMEKTKAAQAQIIQEEPPIQVSEEFKEEAQSVELPWTKYMEKEAR